MDCARGKRHESITAQCYGIFWMLRTSIMKVSHLYEQAPTPPRPLSTIIPRTKTPLAHSSLHLFYGNGQECMYDPPPFPTILQTQNPFAPSSLFPQLPTPHRTTQKKNTTIHSQILHHNIPSHPNPTNPPLLQRQPTHTPPTPTHTHNPPPPPLLPPSQTKDPLTPPQKRGR